MLFARAGRAGVRFVHRLPIARVSSNGTNRASSLLSNGDNASSTYLAASTSLSWVRTFADKPVGRPKQHTGRAPARKTSKAGSKKKSTGSKAKTKTKTKAKPGPKPKKKKVVKVKKTKVVKTPAQIERAKVKAQKEKIKEKKAASLVAEEPPTRQCRSAWQTFIQENLVGSKAISVAERSAKFKGLSAEYKSLTPGEREALNHRTVQNQAALRERYEAWLRSHKLEEIMKANYARRWLRTNNVLGFRKVRLIKDPRRAKQPITSWMFFNKERSVSGDFKGIKVAERAKLISGEWKELPQSEKQRFEDLANEDRARYRREMQQS